MREKNVAKIRQSGSQEMKSWISNWDPTCGRCLPLEAGGIVEGASDETSARASATTERTKATCDGYGSRYRHWKEIGSYLFAKDGGTPFELIQLAVGYSHLV